MIVVMIKLSEVRVNAVYVFGTIIINDFPWTSTIGYDIIIIIYLFIYIYMYIFDKKL